MTSFFSNEYSDCLRKLYAINRSRGIRFDLSGIEALMNALNHPERTVKAIHVAGTNGKGSVSTKIAAALSASGFKTGLYTSPHISSFRERIRIDGAMISEEAIMKYLAPLLESEASFFECVTAAAFSFFAASEVERAVLEVGLGGRLDATNVCRPLVTVITSISLDHTAELGESIESITKEKAGIMKPQVPLVIGPRVSRALIVPLAEEKNVPLVQVEGDFASTELENCAVAKAALDLLGVEKQAQEIGLKALPPCRFEEVDTRFGRVVLDVAHNPDGIRRLLDRLQKSYPKSSSFVFVYGASKDKDFRACLQLLAQFAKKIICVQADSPRAASTAELAQVGGFEEALSVEEAIEQAAKEQAVIVIVGTFFIMSQARCFLGYIEPRDLLDLNEGIRQI